MLTGFRKKLPSGLRSTYTELLQELIEIEDIFEGGPRVPTIRSYAFNGQLTHQNYREKIRLVEQDVSPDHNPFQLAHLYCFPFGHNLSQNGWHQIVASQKPRSKVGNIRCDEGESAHYIHEGDLRLGALSKFPFMENIDQPNWGMSWQSMPVALSSSNGDWGFLRWGTKEAGIERFFPAKNKHSAYLKNALTDTVSPAISGQTFSIANNDSFLILRRMPQISKAWEWCHDAFTLHDFTGKVIECSELEDNWYRLTLEWETQKRLTVDFNSLESEAKPELSQTKDLLEWKIIWKSGEISKANQFNGLWVFHLGEHAPSPPKLMQKNNWFHYPHFTLGDAVWEIDWNDHIYTIDANGLNEKN